MSIPQILYLVEGNVYTVLRFLVQIAAVLRREGERLQNVVLQQKVENIICMRLDICTSLLLTLKKAAVCLWPGGVTLFDKNPIIIFYPQIKTSKTDAKQRRDLSPLSHNNNQIIFFCRRQQSALQGLVSAYVVCPYCDPNYKPYPNVDEACRGYDVPMGNPIPAQGKTDPGKKGGQITNNQTKDNK